MSCDLISCCKITKNTELLIEKDIVLRKNNSEKITC